MMEIRQDNETPHKAITPIKESDRRTNKSGKARLRSSKSKNGVESRRSLDLNYKPVEAGFISQSTRVWSVSRFAPRSKRPLSPLSSSTSNTVALVNLAAEIDQTTD